MTACPLTVQPAVAPRARTGPTPVFRTVLALWLAVGAAAGVRTLLRPASHTVFPVFAAAGGHWWHDQPIYRAYRPLDYFRYPPVAALFFSPFAALGLRAGGVLWTALSLGVYASGLWQFRRAVLPAGWSPRREVAFFALATAGALAGLWNAQSNALAVGLLLWGGAALARGRDGECAAWLAAAVWLKLTPLAPALLLCALWPRRLAGRFALALAAGAAVPFLTRPPGVVLDHYAEWGAQLVGLSDERWPGFRDAWTVWQVARSAFAEGWSAGELLRPIDSTAYRVVQAAAAAACLGWCLAVRRRGAARRQLVLRTLGTGAAWLMLFGPAVEAPTYVFLAPFLAAAAVDPAARRAGRALAVVATVLVLGLGWGELTVRLVPELPVILAALPTGTALFAAGLLLEEPASRPAPRAVRRADVARRHLTAAAA